jgi:hypothetical protein
VVISCLLAGAVHAQAKHTDPPEYQKLVQQALHEYELGNFSEAKAFFSQANDLSPNARTLRGLGMSSYELRNYVEAIDYFQKSLDSSERALTVRMRSEVSQLLQQARGFVTRLELSVQPSTADVRIDTRPVSKDADGFVLLDPGQHELVAEAADYESTTRTIRTDGGEKLTLNVVLHAVGKPDVAETHAPEAPAQSSVAIATPLSSESPSAVGPWILIGSSAAVAIAGGVFIALWAKDTHTVEHPATNPAPMYANVAAAESRTVPFSAIGFSALGVGVAGLIAGIVWKVSQTGTEQQPSAQLDIGPSGVRLHGQF